MLYTRDVRQAVTLVTANTAEPHTLAQARNHLRVDSDIAEDNTLITAQYAAARAAVEAYTGRALYAQRWRLTLSEFPDVIELPRAPLLEVVSVKYYDTSTVPTEQTMLLADYHILVDDCSLEPTIGTNWPATAAIRGSVNVEFWAGYTNGINAAFNSATTQVEGDPVSRIPSPLKAATLILLGDLYENREQSIIGSAASLLPWGAEALMAPYRVGRS